MKNIADKNFCIFPFLNGNLSEMYFDEFFKGEVSGEIGSVLYSKLGSKIYAQLRRNLYWPLTEEPRYNDL
jgi:hypothetical protein